MEKWEVWLLAERYEDHGTDVQNIVGVYATEASALLALAAENANHNWRDTTDDDGDTLDWCACHGQDWIVDGPYEVIK